MDRQLIKQILIEQKNEITQIFKGKIIPLRISL